jgi:hypothetical protein
MINKSGWNNLFIIGSIIMFMFIHGCASVPYKAYTGTIPEDKIIKITGKTTYDPREYNPGDPKIYFLKVDNVKAFSYFLFLGNLLTFSAPVEEVLLTPGKHNFQIRYDDHRIVYSYANLEFIAEEGKEYQVVANIRKIGWTFPTIQFGIIEINSGKYVQITKGNNLQPPILDLIKNDEKQL